MSEDSGERNQKETGAVTEESIYSQPKRSKGRKNKRGNRSWTPRSKPPGRLRPKKLKPFELETRSDRKEDAAEDQVIDVTGRNEHFFFQLKIMSQWFQAC